MLIESLHLFMIEKSIFHLLNLVVIVYELNNVEWDGIKADM